MKQDIEFKNMIGDRRKNGDGFTYCYGGRVEKYGSGCLRRSRKNLIPRCKRNDKRSVKAKAIRRILKESEINFCRVA